MKLILTVFFLLVVAYTGSLQLFNFSECFLKMDGFLLLLMVAEVGVKENSAYLWTILF